MIAKLQGKVALVTGGGRGIGLALVHKLAAEGAHLVINDLDEAPVAAVAGQLRSDGIQVATCAGSVTAADFPRRFIDTALERFGRIDILVNNAGYIWNSKIGSITDEQWDAMQDVHLKAPFRLLRALYPVLKQRAQGGDGASPPGQFKVVNVSSVSASKGWAGQAAYSAAKSGLFGLTRTLASEWGPLGVNVNCVAFGLIDTRLTQEIRGETAISIAGREHRVGLPGPMLDEFRSRVPLRRSGTTDEAAGAILLLCLPEADYISGQIVEVAGGLG